MRVRSTAVKHLANEVLCAASLGESSEQLAKIPRRLRIAAQERSAFIMSQDIRDAGCAKFGGGVADDPCNKGLAVTNGRLLLRLRNIAADVGTGSVQALRIARLNLQSSLGRVQPFNPESLDRELQILRQHFDFDAQVLLQDELAAEYNATEYNADYDNVQRMCALGMLFVAQSAGIGEDIINIPSITYFELAELSIPMSQVAMRTFFESMYFSPNLTYLEQENLMLCLAALNNGTDYLIEVVDIHKLQFALAGMTYGEIAATFTQDEIHDLVAGTRVVAVSSDSDLSRDTGELLIPGIEFDDDAHAAAFDKNLAQAVDVLQSNAFSQCVSLALKREQLISAESNYSGTVGAVIGIDDEQQIHYDFDGYIFTCDSRLAALLEPSSDYLDLYDRDVKLHLEWETERQSAIIQAHKFGLFDLSMPQLTWLYENAVNEVVRDNVGFNLAREAKEEVDKDALAKYFESEVKNSDFNPLRRANALYALVPLRRENFIGFLTDMVMNNKDPFIRHYAITILAELTESDYCAAEAEKSLLKIISDDITSGKPSFALAVVNRLGRVDGLYGDGMMNLMGGILQKVFSEEHGTVERKRIISGHDQTIKINALTAAYELLPEIPLFGAHSADGSSICLAKHSLSSYISYLGFSRLMQWTELTTQPTIQRNAWDVMELVADDDIRSALMPGSGFSSLISSSIGVDVRRDTLKS